MGPAQTGQRRWVVVSASLGQCALSRLRQRDEHIAASAISEKSEVADADQPFRENVDQESSQKLICGNRHDFLLAAPCVVFPAKRDSIILERHQSMVGDGDAVRIAGEIVQNMFRTSEGWLGVDHPVFAEEESQERVESAGLSKTLE